MQNLKELNELSVYANFLLKKKITFSDQSLTVLEFEHTQTKTPLIAVKNDDENKSFCIGFRTLPQNSKGIPHILEHSVLSGSLKYPIKDVFAELLKGSLTTFINAMTYPDKTLYPFSTRNEKEYFSLMDVYLDLTLNPLLEKDTFLQEGWHYEIQDKDSPLTYNGIVYNEMKGAYSSPLRLLYEFALVHLMPNSTYAFSSGGIPREITKLSYEEFKQFHEDNYHPSNAKMVVYGNAPLIHELELIDIQFLSKFSYKESKSNLVLGDTLKKRTLVEDTYPVLKDEKSNNVYFSISTILPISSSFKEHLAWSLLSNVLVNTEASIMKSYFSKHQVGKEIVAEFENLYKPFFCTYVIQSTLDKAKNFLNIYDKALKEVQTNGFNKEILEAGLNLFEFNIKESRLSTKRGLDYTIDILSCLMYDYDYIDIFKENQMLSELRNEVLKENYLEALINKHLLNNVETLVYILKPEAQKAQKLQKKIEKELMTFKESLSQEELKDYITNNQKLKEKQAIGNSPEELSLLPKLKLTDLETNLSVNIPHTKTLCNTQILNSIKATNGIAYVRFGFDISHLSFEELSLLQTLAILFCEIGTHNRDYKKLANDLDLYTGSFYNAFRYYSHFSHDKKNKPIFWISFSCLETFTDEAFNIISDVFQNISFKNIERIQEVLGRTIAETEEQILSDGYFLSSLRLKSYLSTSGKYSELFHGFSNYEQINKIYHRFFTQADLIVKQLSELCSKVFCKDNIIIHTISGNTFISKLETKIKVFLQTSLSEIAPQKMNQSEPLLNWSNKKVNEAFIVPSDVNYVGLGLSLFEANQSYPIGLLDVIKVFLDRDYLYNQLRVLGGAYGNFSDLNIVNGNYIFISYRDPHVNETYKTYKNIPSILRSFQKSKKELDQFKISAYSKLNPLLSPYQQGVKECTSYIIGFTQEKLLTEVDQILSVTGTQIKEHADLFENAIQKAYFSSVGQKEIIEKAQQQYFEELYQI